MTHSLSQMLYEDKDPAAELMPDVNKIKKVLKENNYSDEEISYLLENYQIDEIFQAIIPAVATGVRVAAQVGTQAAKVGAKAAVEVGKTTARVGTAAIKTGVKAVGNAAKEVVKNRALNIASDIAQTVTGGQDETDDGAFDSELDNSEEIDENISEEIFESFTNFNLRSLLSEENTAINNDGEQQNSEGGNKEEEEESEEGGGGGEEKEEEDKPIKTGEELSDDDLTSDESIKHSDLTNKVAPGILDHIKGNTKIQKMIALFDKWDPENPDPELKEKIDNYVEEIKKGDSGNGLMDLKALKGFYTKPFQVPSLGKVILNPMQMKKGADQKAGVTATDIDVYKKLKMIPFFAMTKKGTSAETVSGHVKGKNLYIVFCCPAIGAVIENETDVSNYRKVFPNYSNDVNLEIGHVVQDTDEIRFCYVEGEEGLEKLQNNFVQEFSRRAGLSGLKSDGKESEPANDDSESNSSDTNTNNSNSQSQNNDEEKITAGVSERFVYQDGLSLLLEANKAFSIKNFIEIVKDDEDVEGQKKRKVDLSKIDTAAKTITYQNFEKFVVIANEETKKKRKEKTAAFVGATQVGVESLGQIGTGLTKAYMATSVTAGIGAGSLGAFTAGLGTLSMLPYVMGAQMALPHVTKAATGIAALSGFAYNKYQENKFNKKDINEKIKEALGKYLHTGEETDEKGKITKTMDFKSVAEEAKKLSVALKRVIEETIATDNEKQTEENIKERKEDVLIEEDDFHTECNRENYQLTTINDIPEQVYLSFIVDCNDLLSQSKIQINGAAGYRSQLKTGGKLDPFKQVNDASADGSVSEEQIEEMKQKLIEQMLEYVDSIPDDSQTVILTKNAIKVKLSAGDVDSAWEWIENLLQNPDNFTKDLEEMSEEELEDDEAVERAAKKLNVDPDSLKEAFIKANMFFITPKEIEMLKELDQKIADCFGVDPSDYKRLPEKFRFRYTSKCITYKKRSDLKEEYKDTNILVRPSAWMLRKSFSFPGIVRLANLSKDESSFLRESMLLIVTSVMSQDASDVDDNFNSIFEGIEEHIEDSYQTKIKSRFENILKYIKNEKVQEKIKSAKEDSGWILQESYYNKSLSSLLFESNLEKLSLNTH